MNKERIAMLIEQIKNNNNQSAFNELITLTQETLIKTAYYYLHDEMLAEDVVNDVYLELINNCKKIKNSTNLLGYLRIIVINKSLNLLKRRKREITFDNSKFDVTKPQTSEQEIENIAVRYALSKLKEEERTVLLYLSFGYTLNETATEMNCSIKRIRILIEKAKKHFVKFYEINEND